MQPLTCAMVVTTAAFREQLRPAIAEAASQLVLDQAELGDLPGFLERLEQVRPDVVVIEVAAAGMGLAEVFKKIRGSAGAPAIVVVHSAAEPDVILSAMRAGAAEFLYPPLVPNLKAALHRMAGERAESRSSAPAGGKTIAFLSAKGGCGATTVACHVSVELPRQTRQKVLLADFDLDAGMVHFLLKTKAPYSVLDAAQNVHRLDHSFWRALVSNGQPGLEIVAAPAAGPSEPPPGDALRHVVRFVRPLYDWIIADLGRSLNLLSMSVLEEMDQTFLVTTLDVPALYQAKHVVQMLIDGGYGRHRLHVVLNRMPKRPEVTLHEIEQMLGLPVYAVLPNDEVGLHEAYSGGGLAQPTSHLGAQFTRLAATVAGIPEPKQKSKFSFFG